MIMASNNAVSALLKPSAEHGRNVFPLDCKHVYSMKAGQINPVKCFHYEPGTYFDMQAHDFTMTFPMQTAPFLRGRKETAFYSVYYNAVWSLFNQYQATKSDPKTSAFGQDPILNEPRIRLYSLYFSVYSQFVQYLFSEVVLPRLLRFQSDNISDERVKELCNTWLKRDFNVAFHLRPSFELSGVSYSIDASFTYEEELPVVEPNITNYDYCTDIVGHFRVYSWIRKLDMLGYGNLYPLFNDVERRILDFETSQGADAYRSFVEELLHALCRRLWNITHTFKGTFAAPTDIVSKMANLYPICAYNAVFYHFFRNSYYDLDYYVHDYNLDFVSAYSGGHGYNVVSMEQFSLRFLDIEYHQWKKDTFTAVLPDTQFGAVASLKLTGTDTEFGVTGTGTVLTSSDVTRWRQTNGELLTYGSELRAGNSQLYQTASARDIEHDHSVSVSAIASRLSVEYQGFDPSFDVIALKRSEMLQQYRQQLMRAGNRTSDVFRAIYGGAPSSEHEDDVIPRFLDTFGEDIFVDPVESTANTGDTHPNGQLGDIAARGKFQGSSPRIKFNAGNNFGLILVLTYVVPTAEYNSYMFDKHIFELTPQAHYIPQFENFGLEQVMSDELNSLLPANTVRALGFAPNYYHKKSEVDQVHGAFCSVPDELLFGDSAGESSAVFSRGRHVSSWYGDFNNWVSPRSDMQFRTSTALRDFYINPSVLDNIFVRAAGPDLADDQFICNTYFEVKSTKTMSKVGLINFV